MNNYRNLKNIIKKECLSTLKLRKRSNSGKNNHFMIVKVDSINKTEKELITIENFINIHGLMHYDINHYKTKFNGTISDLNHFEIPKDLILFIEKLSNTMEEDGKVYDKMKDIFFEDEVPVHTLNLSIVLNTDFSKIIGIELKGFIFYSISPTAAEYYELKKIGKEDVIFLKCNKSSIYSKRYKESTKEDYFNHRKEEMIKDKTSILLSINNLYETIKEHL